MAVEQLTDDELAQLASERLREAAASWGFRIVGWRYTNLRLVWITLAEAPNELHPVLTRMDREKGDAAA